MPFRVVPMWMETTTPLLTICLYLFVAEAIKLEESPCPLILTVACRAPPQNPPSTCNFISHEGSVMSYRGMFRVCSPFCLEHPPISSVRGSEISRIVKRTIPRWKCCILANRHENTYCIIWMIQIKYLGLQTKYSVKVPGEVGIFLLWTKLSVDAVHEVYLWAHISRSPRDPIQNLLFWASFSKCLSLLMGH